MLSEHAMRRSQTVSVERVSPLTQSSQSHGRTDGLTKNVLTYREILTLVNVRARRKGEYNVGNGYNLSGVWRRLWRGVHQPANRRGVPALRATHRTNSEGEEMTTWTLIPPWTKPPMSMNDRLHHHVKARHTASIRTTAYLLARQAHIPPCEHVEVAMVWTVPTHGRRDAENPIATLKPFCDGLVDAGVVPDDVPEFMTKHMPRIEYVKGVEAVRFEVRSISAADSRRPASPVPDEKQTGVSSDVSDGSEALRRSGDGAK